MTKKLDQLLITCGKFYVNRSKANKAALFRDYLLARDEKESETNKMNNEIEELKNRIVALERQLQGQNAPATTKVEKPWPQDGDEYWCIDVDGDVFMETFRVNNRYEQSRLVMGNVFRTEEEAEKRVKHIKALVKLRSLAGDYKPDWRLPDRKQYYTLYDCFTGEWIPTFCYAAIMPNQIYFPTAEATEHAIKAMGDQINDLLEGGW